MEVEGVAESKTYKAVPSKAAIEAIPTSIRTCRTSCLAIGIQWVIWQRITPMRRESQHTLQR